MPCSLSDFLFGYPGQKKNAFVLIKNEAVMSFYHASSAPLKAFFITMQHLFTMYSEPEHCNHYVHLTREISGRRSWSWGAGVSAEFGSGPGQTHLIQLIKVLRVCFVGVGAGLCGDAGPPGPGLVATVLNKGQELI